MTNDPRASNRISKTTPEQIKGGSDASESGPPTDPDEVPLVIPVNECTDEQLQKELERRKRLEAKREVLRAQQHTMALTGLRNFEDLVHILRPEHGRISCDDTHLANGWGSYRPGVGRTRPRCTKCALLEIARGREAVPPNFRVVLTIEPIHDT